MTAEELIQEKIDEQQSTMYDCEKVTDNINKMWTFLKTLNMDLMDLRIGVSGYEREHIFCAFVLKMSEDTSNILVDSKCNLYKIIFNYGFNVKDNTIVFSSINYYKLNVNRVISQYSYGMYECNEKIGNGFLEYKKYKIQVKDGICSVKNGIEEIKNMIFTDLNTLATTFGDLKTMSVEIDNIKKEINKYYDIISDYNKTLSTLKNKQRALFIKKMNILQDFS